MTLEQYAYIAEIVGVIIIVITLIYLAVQVRQGSDALMATSRQATLDADLAFLSKVIDYPELGENRGLVGETIEEVRISAYLVFYLRIREFAWFQYRSGILDENTWRSYVAPTVLVFSTPEARALLSDYRGDPEFIAYLQELLQSPAGSP